MKLYTSVLHNILQKCEFLSVHKQFVLKSPLKDSIIFTKLTAKYFWGCYLSADAEWNWPLHIKVASRFGRGCRNDITRHLIQKLGLRQQYFLQLQHQWADDAPNHFENSILTILRNNFYSWFTGEMRTTEKKLQIILSSTLNQVIIFYIASISICNSL